MTKDLALQQLHQALLDATYKVLDARDVLGNPSYHTIYSKIMDAVNEIDRHFWKDKGDVLGEGRVQQ